MSLSVVLWLGGSRKVKPHLPSSPAAPRWIRNADGGREQRADAALDLHLHHLQKVLMNGTTEASVHTLAMDAEYVRVACHPACLCTASTGQVCSHLHGKPCSAKGATKMPQTSLVQDLR